jgi:hypothetical protein
VVSRLYWLDFLLSRRPDRTRASELFKAVFDNQAGISLHRSSSGICFIPIELLVEKYMTAKKNVPNEEMLKGGRWRVQSDWSWMLVKGGEQ